MDQILSYIYLSSFDHRAPNAQQIYNKNFKKYTFLTNRLFHSERKDQLISCAVTGKFSVSILHERVPLTQHNTVFNCHMTYRFGHFMHAAKLTLSNLFKTFCYHLHLFIIAFSYSVFSTK
jgi:hypothetical protein